MNRSLAIQATTPISRRAELPWNKQLFSMLVGFLASQLAATVGS